MPSISSSSVTLSAIHPLPTTSSAVTTSLAEASSAVPASRIATPSAVTTSVATLNTLPSNMPTSSA